MPPKRRGHNLRGREKIFRNAVQHVHVGIGHNVLGAINMQPAIGTVGEAAEGSGVEDCAFLIELNEQMLHHSTTDFKRFRWEVLDLCGSIALFRLNHRKIAEKLLLALLNRDKFAEGFEAFVRLTVAFARDMREKFFLYFECFHQAINGGIFDGKGQLVVDTRRLQLIFSAQVAWCREMRSYWLQQEHRKLVELIIRLYVRQMHDSKEYIRRLAAEVLASVCRMTRELLPLVLEVASADVVRDFEEYRGSKHRKLSTVEVNGDEEEDRKDVDDYHVEAVEDEQEGNPVGGKAGSFSAVSACELLWSYQQKRLSYLPVVDSMCFLVAEVLRGIRGSLNTSFETYYAVIIYTFGLSACTQRVGTCSSGYGIDVQEWFGVTEEEAQTFVHLSNWKELLNEDKDAAVEGGSAVREKNSSPVLRELVRMIGAASVGTALRVIAEETARSSAPATASTTAEHELMDLPNDSSHGGDDRSPPLQMFAAVVGALEFSAPYVQLIQQLMHSKGCSLLWNSAALPVVQTMIDKMLGFVQEGWNALSGVTTTTCKCTESGWDRFLCACGAVLELFAPLCIDSDTGSRSYIAKLQRACLPLCQKVVAICTAIAFSDAKASNATLPTFRADVKTRTRTGKLLFAFAQDILQKNYAYCLGQERMFEGEPGGKLSESTGAEQVRRFRGTSKVKIYLTPFAFELLGPVLYGATSMAKASIGRFIMGAGGDTAVSAAENLLVVDIESAAFHDATYLTMMVGMMCDRTPNTPFCPLQVLLTMVSTTSARESARNGTDDGECNMTLGKCLDLMENLQAVFLDLAGVFGHLQGEVRSSAGVNRTSKWAEVVTAVLPLALVIAEAENSILKQKSQFDTTKSESLFAWRFRGALVGIISTMKLAACTTFSIRAVFASTSSFSLFAQASAMLLQLAPLCNAPGTDKENAECIKDAVVILATGFRESRNEMLSDEEVGRLLHGVECILHATLRLFGVEENLALSVVDGVPSNEPKASEKRKSSIKRSAEQQHREVILKSLARLNESLGTEGQEALVHVLLFESLVSPIRTLRITALRVLLLFCHPDVSDANRMAGCGPVDPSFFDSLIRAEEFNPLSSAGNLDGAQQALARLSFDAAAGSLQNPLQRVILARAMIGLLHAKYAVVWPIALKMLADLVKIEDTTGSVEKEQHQEHERADSAPAVWGEAEESAKLLKPFVWKGVICKYARLIVFGDIVQSSSVRSHEGDDDDSCGNAPSENHVGQQGLFSGANDPLWYRIQLSDKQRHEKGELVSKDFATAQYKTAAITWNLLANKDGKLLCWGEHYLPAASPTSTHGKMAASRSTDRATLAKTFLSGLADFGHGGASNDAKSTLIAELALELSQVRRGEHPSGVKHLKLLDDRLALALNAYTSVSAGKPAPVDSNKRTSKGTETATNDHVEHLQNVCAGLISDPCAKLQRAALDLLRRLKVAPYSQYHEKLIPYCDTQQNLFHFLSSFHVESDIPQEDRADYIATALAITLPKLTGNVTREKLKNQAVLQRRVLSFVTHVTDAGVFAGILQGLVKRLIFDCVMPTKNVEPETFHFGEWWAKWARKSTHCARQLEHLLRQLFNTTKLLSALMQAVGKGFSSFAGTCLHLGINGYLISCRHVLLSVVNGGSLYPASNDHQSDMPTGEEWQKRAGKALNSSNVKALMARMRREATLVVASLFEQFPEEVMETLWDDVNKIGVTSSGDRLKRSLIGQYIAALRMNSCGAVAELIGDNQRAAATPLLRLVRSWISSHCTLPLVGAFAETVSETIKQLFYSSCSAVNPSSRSASLGGASSKDSHYPLIISALREGLRCVAALLDAGDETIEVFGSTEQSTLRALLIEPYVGEIFTSLYSLIRRSTSSGVSEAKGNARTVANNAERHHPGVMSFNVATWKELIASVSILVPYVVKRHDRVSEEHSREAVAEEGSPMVENTSTMLSRLLEMCITFVDHPACAKDRETGTAAVGVLETLLPHISRVDVALHYEPLALLFNTVTNPEARLTLCRALKIMLTHLSEDPHVASCKESSVGDGVQRGSGGYALQLAAVGRAVSCMNSFADDNNTLERYDFELRFHTLRSLRQFFHNDGEYCTVSRITAMEKYQRRQRDQIREERDYSGDLDVTIPLHPQEAPVMCVEGFLALAANTIFLIRDPEGTISVLATELLEAMIRYASRQNTCVAGYDVLILKRVIRRVILPSLRRGVVSRDVHIRNAHMKAFGALAQYYKHSFRSFASLYSRNAEHNFFSNVGHVQHRCRLNALSLVRQKADSIHPRDALRVFVPFLLAAVKDFAQGKRDQQNLSEGRAKGYCDVALATLAAIAGALPWEGYYRVLSLLLMNAHECPDLRIPMLRGVVLVLDHFHFLDECSEGGDGEKGVKQRAVADDDEDDDCDVDDEKVDDGVEATLMAELRAKRIKYRSARILHVMEDDILPQLYAFLSDGSRKGGTHGSVGEVRVSSHAVTSVRSEMQKADRARQNTAVLQLPVAVAIMKIVKRFPEDRFSLHAEQLLDEVALKLRTKNDKHRERARRVLSAMLCETGPGKLSFVIAKLRSHLVHGYQLHVLGYTVVTLLYNLYEPRHDISYSRRKTPVKKSKENTPNVLPTLKRTPERQVGEGNGKDDEVDPRKERRDKKGKRQPSAEDGDNEGVSDNEEEEEEQALLRSITSSSVRFDYTYGVSCLTACLDDIMTILLDDYLGEVSEQKEQVELMSTMQEIKYNRALQGFTLIASHCQATRVIEVFLQKITWLLTPPSEAANVNVSELRGGARSGALILLNELKTKYSAVSRNATADFAFVQKVRLLAVRVARALLSNATMEIESSFFTVRNLLQRHNEVREKKIKEFESKEGKRRIRGSFQLSAERTSETVASFREQLDRNFLVAPRPERVDVDFSAHTVLATQQKQKLRAYRGRYGKEAQQAAKHFYREDPTTAVVLDTLDEFLLKYLLSVLKQVLGMGKERKSSKAAVRLDLLRARRRMEGAAKRGNDHGKGDTSEEDVQSEEENAAGDDASSVFLDDMPLEPQFLDDKEGDALDTFAAENDKLDTSGRNRKSRKRQRERPAEGGKKQQSIDVTATFTRHYQQILEDLVPVVLSTLHGEGSDAVVAFALDCMMALLLLRPPLRSVGKLHSSLYDTVIGFFERGGAIKQRAMRVAASVISHQCFVLTEAQASKLTSLCHAELVERNEFVPMALSLFNAVLGKHVHVIEVYDLMGVVTEMLLHCSAKRLMRQRCVTVIARFLTEYRMTPEKFRSHIDLLCRNLDYPEVTGRIALLELFIVLIHRLPTVVLREEAPLLLISLTVTLSSSEYHEVRQKAAEALRDLATNAGVDAIVPTLSKWLEDAQPRKKRTAALQTWAVMIPAIATALGLGADTTTSVTDCDDVEASVAEFISCCAWSLPAIMRGAMYDQIGATYKRRCRGEVSEVLRRKAETKGWTYVFFALRCVEAIASAVPSLVWSDVGLAKPLVSFLSSRLILHVHPWVHAVSLRLLRMYCMNGVEPRCLYLFDDEWSKVALANGTKGATKGEKMKKDVDCGDSFDQGDTPRGNELIQTHAPPTTRCNDLFPYVVVFRGTEVVDTVGRAEAALTEISSTLRMLLLYFAQSDVPNEKYAVHRAIQQPARTDAVALTLYLVRSMAAVSMALLVTAMTSGCESRILRARKVVTQHFDSLRRQFRSVALTAISQESVTNVMVRTASLVQCFGGLVAAIPCVHDSSADTSKGVESRKKKMAHNEDQGEHLIVGEAAVWLLCNTFDLTFIQQTVVPTVAIALRCGARSERLSELALQTSQLLREHLEARRFEYEATEKLLEVNAVGTMVEEVAERRKRKRKSRSNDRAANQAEGACRSVEDALFTLTTVSEAVKDAKKDEVTRRTATKTLRKRLRSADAEPHKQQELKHKKRKISWQ